MRRFVAAAASLMMLLSVFSCAPDNIVTPNTPENPSSTTEPTPEPTPEPQTPETTEPDAADEQLTAGAQYLKDKAENTGVKPTLDVDGTGFTDFKTPQLSGVTLSFFTWADSAFSAGELDEKGWLDALKKEYGLTLKYDLRQDDLLYSSQLIAQRAGRQNDLISARVNDFAAALPLMQSAQELVRFGDNSPASGRVFSLTGSRLFAPRGFCRVLWYNKSLAAQTDPFESYRAGGWTTETMTSAFGNLAAGNRLIECKNWLPFGSAQIQASGATEGGYAMLLTDERVIGSFAAFGELFNRENYTASGDFSFEKGNTVMCFADTPAVGEGVKVGWAPVPKLGQDGRYVGELCGSGFGLSATVSDARRGAASAFISLWCARAAESRSDTLIYKLGLTPTEADAYLSFSETDGGIYSADGEVSAVFDAASMPVELYGTPETVFNKFGAAFIRTDMINKRYR